MNLKGNIENIRYRNEENGYTVLLVNTGKAVFTVVGNIASINEGETIDCEVTEYENEQYGKQYKIVSYNIVLPNDSEAIERFLSSREFKGIGKATAKRLVEFFGEETLDVIKNHPEKLYGIKGLTEERISLLRDKIHERGEEVKTIIELEKYGLGPKIIQNIMEVYGKDAVKVINENPYDLAMNVSGIGFVICDNLARRVGYDVSSEKRVAAGLIYTLEIAHANGDVFVEKNNLIENTKELLKLCDDYDFSDIIYNLTMDLKIVVTSIGDKEIVFLKRVYNLEKKLSEILYRKKEDILIITGGPGTGKTYNIKKYLKEAEEKGLKVALSAPTGRAAKRITEVTGHDAKTIHRLLEAGGKDNESYFNKNKENLLDVDVLIVDEMSMVDESLMYHLMEATPDLTKVILVGDVDQLPSVGAGKVLADMIDSGIFEVKKLTEIHRQDEGSNIVVNAHLVNEGKEVDLNADADDFKFIHKSTDDKIVDALKILVCENIPKYFDISANDVQVICASKKGNCGVDSLNTMLQKVINPEDYKKDEIKSGDTIYRLGDKVMQTVNNYDIPYDMYDKDGSIMERGYGVFNGDIGIITEMDSDNRTMTIRYDDKDAYYESKEIKDLSLAYAITVHKSQGSEYDVVVMPMAYAPYQLLNRKILYTAMTRAKKCICFIGYEKYFYEMLKNTDVAKRNTALLSDIYIN